MLMRKILRMLREEKDPQKVKRSERFCRKSREVKYSQKVERSERFCRKSREVKYSQKVCAILDSEHSTRIRVRLEKKASNVICPSLQNITIVHLKFFFKGYANTFDLNCQTASICLDHF